MDQRFSGTMMTLPWLRPSSSHFSSKTEDEALSRGYLIVSSQSAVESREFDWFTCSLIVKIYFVELELI